MGPSRGAGGRAPSSQPLLTMQILGLPHTWLASLLQRTGTQPPVGVLPLPRAVRRLQAAELSLELALLYRRVCVQPSLGPLGSGCLPGPCA